MSVRQIVRDLVKLGPLPDSSAPDEIIAAHRVLLTQVTAWAKFLRGGPNAR
jgi:hypothetical protein